MKGSSEQRALASESAHAAGSRVTDRLPRAKERQSSTSSSVSGRNGRLDLGGTDRLVVGSSLTAPVLAASRKRSRTAERRRCIVAIDGAEPDGVRASRKRRR